MVRKLFARCTAEMAGSETAGRAQRRRRLERQVFAKESRRSGANPAEGREQLVAGRVFLSLQKEGACGALLLSSAFHFYSHGAPLHCAPLFIRLPLASAFFRTT